MICNELRDHLSAYHDGELDAPQRAEVEAHVRACPDCRAALDEFTRIGDLLRAGCEMPADVWQRVAAVVRRSRVRLRLRTHLIRAGAVAAGFALYLLGHNLLTSVGRAPDRPQPAAAPRVEALLQDAALALRGRGLEDRAIASLDGRPETLLLRKIVEDTEP